MTRLSQNIAQNIATKRHDPFPGERIFAGLTVAADTVGVARVATMKGAVMAADGIGVVREKAVAAWPGVRARLSQKSAAMAEAARQNAEAARKARAEKAADLADENQIVPLMARRRWSKALAGMGKAHVWFHLEEAAHLPSNAPFTRCDTGITHGATRYPTIAFAKEWLGDDVEDDNGGHWRILAICATGAMAAAGLLLWSIM